MGKPNAAGYRRINDLLQIAPAPGKAEYIARAALFLAGDGSQLINGDVLTIDAGWTCL